jgi:hypothetical protein
MTYYRKQRMESFKRAMFADKLDRTLAEDDTTEDKAANESWWLAPFDRSVVMEPSKLAS